MYMCVCMYVCGLRWECSVKECVVPDTDEMQMLTDRAADKHSTSVLGSMNLATYGTENSVCVIQAHYVLSI